MKIKKWLIICMIVSICLLINACGETAKPRMIAQPPISANPVPLLIDVVINPTPSLTPFLPEGYTFANIIQNTNENQNPWGNYLPPSIWPPTEIPPPIGIYPLGKGNIPILLLGDDQRDDPSFRTDAIMLLTLKPAQGKASLVSFPRDIYVYVPGWTMQRINVVMERGGYELLATTFEYNFGVRPTYYARINFSVLKKIIDDLGGIDVQVPYTISDSVGGDPTRTIPAGLIHFDGDTADWYLRARWQSSDYDRTRRHQEILFAVFSKIISVQGLTKVNELYNTYIQNVDTNITLNEITQWLPLAPQLQQSNNIEHFKIGEQQVTPWNLPTSGSMVLLPKRDLVAEIMQRALQ